MKHSGLLRAGMMALAFVLLGGCLWLAGTRLPQDNGGFSVDAVSLPGGGGTLYLPRSPGGVMFSPDGEGDGHIHWETTSRSPAVLILRGTADGSGSMAAELARRNVAVLLVGPDISPAGAWDWLEEQSFVSGSAMGLFASRSRADQALELSEALSERCACTVLLGDGDVMRSAAASSGRNLLLLMKKEPAREAELAFFGSEKGAERGFSGYYGEGTARSVQIVERGSLTFSRRSAMERIIDWQGSCLGHVSGLPDGDLVYERMLFCRAGAWSCFVLAAGALLCRRKIRVE